MDKLKNRVLELIKEGVSPEVAVQTVKEEFPEAKALFTSLESKAKAHMDMSTGLQDKIFEHIMDTIVDNNLDNDSAINLMTMLGIKLIGVSVGATKDDANSLSIDTLASVIKHTLNSLFESDKLPLVILDTKEINQKVLN